VSPYLNHLAAERWLLRSTEAWKTSASFLYDLDKMSYTCRNPTLAKCGGEAQHLEKLEVWSPPGLPNVQSSTSRPKTPRIGVFLVSLKRSWNVNIENGLALAIRTSAAQVMGKRRAGSQTGSLTPDVALKSATWRWKALDESYNFDSGLVPIRAWGEELWPFKVPRV